MSTGFKFRLAGQAEDGALRAVLRQTAMPGSVSLAFGREPSFFIAERAGNLKHQTPIYQDQATGKIAGVGGRSIRKLYVDGAPQTVGYLSGLRALPEIRGSTVLARAYKYLHSLHADGQAPYYLSTILEENTYARAVLTSGRAGMPNYVPVGALVTYLIPLRRQLPSRLGRHAHVCDQVALVQAQRCLGEWNSRYQFAPVYGLEDVAGRTSLLPNFCLRDWYVFRARRGVVGTMGVWNQQSFKQTIVASYSAKMKLARPFYNGVAWLSGRPALPNVGENVRFVYAALMSAQDDNLEVFEALINKARADWSGLGHDYLVVGLVEGNPLSLVARSLASRELRSIVYLVHWSEDKAVLPANNNGRGIHLEAATL